MLIDIRFIFQPRDSVASGTKEDEPYQPWKAEIVFYEEAIVHEDTPFRNVLWRQRGKAIMYSRCNMADGVLRRDTLIEHIANTGDLEDVGMEREDLGPMTFTF